MVLRKKSLDLEPFDMEQAVKTSTLFPTSNEAGCWACNKTLDFLVDEGFAVPIGNSGDAVPNSYIGDWSGAVCCKSCFELHTLWSNRFMYLEYMIKDGRLELSSEDLANYGSYNNYGRGHAKD